MYERSSIEIALFVFICYQTWPPQANLVSDWLIFKKNQKQELPMAAMFVNGSGQNEQSL
jgi:hypothetical protein